MNAVFVMMVVSALLSLSQIEAKCGKNITELCPLCCAILYSNRDCDLQPREFRLIKDKADGFLGIIVSSFFLLELSDDPKVFKVTN